MRGLFVDKGIKDFGIDHRKGYAFRRLFVDRGIKGRLKRKCRTFTLRGVLIHKKYQGEILDKMHL